MSEDQHPTGGQPPPRRPSADPRGGDSSDTAAGLGAAARELERRAGAVEQMAALTTGPDLAALVDSLLPDADALSLFERVELVAMARRVESWAHHAVARAAASVDRHADMHTTAPTVPGREPLRREQVTAGALAMRLQVTPQEAERLVREGRAYDGVLAPTGEALAAGQIDAPRARAIVDGVRDHPGEVAWAVQDEVLPGAPGRTAGQLRHDVARALVRVDELEAIDRHLKAREHRCVGRPRTLQDGMAGFWVVLPTTEAAQVDAVLDGAARQAKAGGDARTFGQLRADELCDLLLGQVTGGGDEGRGSTRAGAPEPAPTGEPAETERRTGADADADRAVARVRSRAPRTQVLVTVPLSTLIGADDAPGEVAGIGVVDAVQARALALGGVWRRILTDPLSGTVLDVGRTRYRPPAALDEHVRIRDRYCSAPGCLVPAARSDLDHSKGFHESPDGGDPGATSHGNLGPACRYHHRLKTEARFRVTQDEPGRFVWATPTGHRFRTHPGTDAPVVDLTESGGVAGHTPSPDPGEGTTAPPF